MESRLYGSWDGHDPGVMRSQADRKSLEDVESRSNYMLALTATSCPSGHTLCFSYKNKVNKCPICRKEIGQIHCLALEKLAASLHLPCSYHHLDCPFTGDIHELMSHLKQCHKLDLQAGSTFNHRYVKQDPHSVGNCSWTLTLFNCFDCYFCLHSEAFVIGCEPVYMTFICFMGEESEARKNWRPWVQHEMARCTSKHQDHSPQDGVRQLRWAHSPELCFSKIRCFCSRADFATGSLNGTLIPDISSLLLAYFTQ
ncbi:hypothetical protein ZIOFF_072199 [Zingiber officinale]|uniref:Uncharacterized protein n=1 Tax=Zingiber officinale TaxID=94328 RepID=A0A8J5CAN1_ZINOF|nr:hypothetical protein ZIOFF_072199 [Zingiber officinale]